MNTDSPTPHDRLLSRKEAAVYLGVSAPTLALWARTRASELPYIQIGRLIKYRQRDLDAFIQRNTVTRELPKAEPVPAQPHVAADIASESFQPGEVVEAEVADTVETVA